SAAEGRNWASMSTRPSGPSIQYDDVAKPRADDTEVPTCGSPWLLRTGIAPAGNRAGPAPPQAERPSDAKLTTATRVLDMAGPIAGARGHGDGWGRGAEGGASRLLRASARSR